MAEHNQDATPSRLCQNPVYCAFFEREIDTLYQASQMLARSLDVHETAREVLKLLHEKERLHCGMICLLDERSGDLRVSAVHKNRSVPAEHVRYQPGEGIVGKILESGQAKVVPRLAEEPRFLDRLGVYDPDRPFIGVPISFGSDPSAGVLAAQPSGSGILLQDQARLLEMIANLIGQTIRLSRSIEMERRHLREERDSLRRAVKERHGFENIIGHTGAMKFIFEQVRMVAKWNTTVLIRGESGTGKELIAHAIHYSSPRASGPLLKVNCSALPDNLLESELFGHEKGAFTGASIQRKGRFELADGGTLFLDEIGDISPAFQSKLLRVLQEGEFERVGGNRTLKVDIRVIAATNRDLETAVERGDFREDLYYRLNVMPIKMPPLRERIDDVPDLARFLVAKIAAKQSRELAITQSAVHLLVRHSWPGNVRELENCLERAAVMSESGTIDRDAVIVAGIRADARAPSVPSAERTERVEKTASWQDAGLDERERVIAALEDAGWVQAKAARLLNMTPRQIAYRIQTLNITLRKI